MPGGDLGDAGRAGRTARTLRRSVAPSSGRRSRRNRRGISAAGPRPGRSGRRLPTRVARRPPRAPAQDLERLRERIDGEARRSSASGPRSAGRTCARGRVVAHDRRAPHRRPSRRFGRAPEQAVEARRLELEMLRRVRLGPGPAPRPASRPARRGRSTHATPRSTSTAASEESTTIGRAGGLAVLTHARPGRAGWRGDDRGRRAGVERSRHLAEGQQGDECARRWSESSAAVTYGLPDRQSHRHRLDRVRPVGQCGNRLRPADRQTSSMPSACDGRRHRVRPGSASPTATRPTPATSAGTAVITRDEGSGSPPARDADADGRPAEPSAAPRRCPDAASTVVSAGRLRLAEAPDGRDHLSERLEHLVVDPRVGDPSGRDAKPSGRGPSSRSVQSRTAASPRPTDVGDDGARPSRVRRRTTLSQHEPLDRGERGSRSPRRRGGVAAGPHLVRLDSRMHRDLALVGEAGAPTARPFPAAARGSRGDRRRARSSSRTACAVPRRRRRASARGGRRGRGGRRPPPGRRRGRPARRAAARSV